MAKMIFLWCVPILFVCVGMLPSVTMHGHRSPAARIGCHLANFSRNIREDNCVQAVITIQACRGCCKSWTVPSTEANKILHPGKNITSKASCCTILESRVIRFHFFVAEEWSSKQ
uniref:Thyrostimulin alpha-2 subunit-like n=1 Tax=Ciona intestinalis TaxID=7719 RepID=F7AY10_CIOIN|nr:thyrostimulin alpha-2 subunit-like [Ciona intestinalis]|eukprot:XP_026689873.1 thyrostimulin alpha-2 subunit-like [Ciona intestinalis]